MKIHPCSKPAEQPLLSFEEACREEGIYQPTARPYTRLIVVKSLFGDAFLLLDCNEIIIARSAAWQATKFLRLPEVLCLETRREG